MIKKYLITFFLIIIIFCIFSNIINFYIKNNRNYNTTLDSSNNLYFPSDKNFFWPTPGYYNITSYFGSRTSPISGKLSTHSGIDIGATEGSYIYAIQSGIVSFLGFNGANGYSIHIENNNFIFIYGHVSPNFIITKNQYINIGEIIGNIGPKYVTPILENPYKDKTGKSTNGSTTGPHLHLTIKKDGKAVNPLFFL